MDKLYRETKANLLSLTDLLTRFELSTNQEEADIKSKITSNFNQISVACDQLDIFVSKEPVNRRYDAKIKIDQLKYDFSHFKQAYNQIQYKKDKRLVEEKRREELFKSDFRTSDKNNTSHVQFNLDGFQNELRHNNRLSNFKNEIDRMIDHGENVLKHVQTQNVFLKDFKKKILNVTNSLGLSNSLIGMIERRNTSDKYVLIGGMVFTCIVMFFAIKYLL